MFFMARWNYHLDIFNVAIIIHLNIIRFAQELIITVVNEQ